MQIPVGVEGWGEGEVGISVEGTGRERVSTGLFLERVHLPQGAYSLVAMEISLRKEPHIN